MDSLLLVGTKDEKLPKFLTKLGYGVTVADQQPVPELIAKLPFDLVLAESSMDLGGVELCKFLRGQPATKMVPIVLLTKRKSEELELKELRLPRVECVLGEWSIGTLASKISTEIRLLKMNGVDNSGNATLIELNASLRDLNQRFARELDDARAIQRSLLPEKVPSGAGFELGAFYKPLEEVGGDWYFATPLTDGRISVQIADVTGHGLAAAFIGAMTKLALSAASSEDPGTLLTGTNRLMAPQLPTGRFVTMFTYVFNPANGTLQYARGGHNPALHLKRAAGTVDEVKGDGFAVGFLEDAEFPTNTLQLEVNDIFVMYTDGLTEAKDRNKEMYGVKRLVQALLATTPEMTSQQVVDAIVKHFETFRDGRRLKDDITIMALKRTAT